jgi:hypothetical protein
MKQKKYFKLARNKALVQKMMHHPSATQFLSGMGAVIAHKKPIENGFWKKLSRKFAELTSKDQPEIILSRAVMDCKKGMTQDYWELSLVELNGIRNSFKDLVDSYGETFVLLSYITLFAAAFPLGPVIALVYVIIEIRYFQPSLS